MRTGLIVFGSIFFLLLSIPATAQTGVEVSPEDLFKAAAAAKSAGDMAKAEAAYRTVIKLCDTDALRDQVGVHKAWMGVAECCYRQKKYPESYAAYDHVEKEYREKLPDVAAEAAYYRYRAATALYASTKEAADGKLKKAARTRFALDYPDHPRAIDLMYYLAAEQISDADMRLHSGKKDEAHDLYESAFKTMDRLSRKSVLHEKAEMRKGEILFKLEKYDEALIVFMGVLAVESDPPRADHKANLRQAKAGSTYYGALCFREREMWEGVLEMLDGFEATFDHRDLKFFSAPVILLRVRACLGLGALKEAEAGAQVLKDNHPRSDAAPEAFELLGNRWRDAGIAARFVGDRATMQLRLTKAEERYRTAIGFLSARLEKLHEKATTARGRLQESIDRINAAIQDLGEER